MLIILLSEPDSGGVVVGTISAGAFRGWPILLVLLALACGGGGGADLSGKGGNCSRSSDCRSGLKCQDYVCVDEDTPEADTRPQKDTEELNTEDTSEATDAWHPGDTLPEAGAKPDTVDPGVCAPGIGTGARTDAGHGMAWVRIPGGCFLMGCSSGDELCDDGEKPQHEVRVKTFYMLEAEVTEGQYEALIGSNPSCHYNGATGSDLPVECVDWEEASTFCGKLGGRLPTEAEWEYGARAGAPTSYSCGNDASCLDGVAWYAENSGDSKHAVKGKAKNAYGLFDMLGNVYEWTDDCYHYGYKGAPADGSAWVVPSGPNWVVRGGSWASTAAELRVSERTGGGPSTRNQSFGFRCAKR